MLGHLMVSRRQSLAKTGVAPYGVFLTRLMRDASNDRRAFMDTLR